MNSSANADWAAALTLFRCSSIGAASPFVPTRPFAIFSNTEQLKRTGSYGALAPLGGSTASLLRSPVEQAEYWS